MLRAVGHPVAVNPDAELARVALEEGWEILHFDRLGRRLRVGAALVGAATLGGLGSVAARRRPATPRGARGRLGLRGPVVTAARRRA
jgi:hypothetical protein